MTAAEAVALLQSDPEWVQKNEEREAQRKALEAQLKADEAPLVEALNNAGVQVSSVWDLVNSQSSYAAAIPVFAQHLKLPYHPKIVEGIARALTVKEARNLAGRALLERLQRTDAESAEMRWALPKESRFRQSWW
jgi:hypothetical protein